MSAFGFVYRFYKSGDIGNVCRPCGISLFDLKLANKRLNSKKEDLIKHFLESL